jgi:CheY-like chemotaxis protein
MRRALLAEDDETNQLYAISLLERDGWRVELAKTGHEAVALAAGGEYDVILMDCQMPELGGYDAAEEIRRLEGDARRTPIIALTAHATKSDREQCLAAGMDAYLAKPFDVAELEDALDRARTRELPGAAVTQDHLSAVAQQNAVLDARVLAQLSQAVAMQVAELFIRTAGERIAELATAEAAGDTATARALAHRLKGSAATIGATQMSEACAALGTAIAVGEAVAIVARQAELVTAFTLTKAALGDYDTVSIVPI